MLSLAKQFQKHLQKKVQDRKPAVLGDCVLQTWWVVEKCVSGPESGNTFCEVVGTRKKEQKNLKRPYRQTPVLVLTRSATARKGIPINWKPEYSLSPVALCLSPIDYSVTVFDDWD